MEQGVRLGDKVKDKITGLTGIATGYFRYLNGQEGFFVQPQEVLLGEPVHGTWIDKLRLAVVDSRPLDFGAEKRA